MGRVGFIALTSPPGPTSLTRLTCPILERETGIEPATNSLEGCDSTTELLPPSRLRDLWLALRRAGPPSTPTLPATSPINLRLTLACQPQPASASATAGEGWWRGKDSNLRSR